MNDQATSEFIQLQAALAGRYSLQRELGRGGMGVVYLALDVPLDRPVALKVLQPQLARQPALKQRFLNEARTAAKLSHPNITPIFAVDEAGEFVFFVMAFIDGETLGQRIRSRGPLPAAELAKILRDVGWALAYAHAQGVVHRDVKADNILLERGSGRALVVDFGIARVIQPTGAPGAGELLGTADYMSPEQAKGEVADHRSDIYSLGVVAWYALSGRLPFEGPTVAEVLARQITQPPPPVAESVPGLPTALARAVDRCLAKNPAARFGNAEELADAVSGALAARREAPRPIREFIRKSGDLGQGMLWVTYFQVVFLGTGALLSLTPEGLGVEVFLGLAAAFLTADPILGAGLLAQIRDLLKSGYTRDDLAAVWNRELQLDREERKLEHGRVTGPLERISRWAFGLGWATLGLAVAAGPGLAFGDIIGPIAYSAGSLGGILSLWQYDSRTSLSRRLTGWFLKSRLGRWAFGLAGLGLDRQALAATATHRPTELAIGMAVDKLFEALPESTRLELAALPAVVRQLEADALKIRQRVDELEQPVTRRQSRYPQVTTGESDRREKLEREFLSTRDAAKQRLADTVTALETIRLGLLRLTAGAGGVEGLTADLADARAVSEDVDRLLEAREEVEIHLSVKRGATDSSPRLTPTGS